MPTFFAIGLVISNSTSTHQGWLQRDQWYTEYRTDKCSIKFWTFAVTFILNTAIQSFHKTYWFIMMYHQTNRHVYPLGVASVVWNGQMCSFEAGCVVFLSSVNPYNENKNYYCRVKESEKQFKNHHQSEKQLLNYHLTLCFTLSSQHSTNQTINFFQAVRYMNQSMHLTNHTKFELEIGTSTSAIRKCILYRTSLHV